MLLSWHSWSPFSGDCLKRSGLTNSIVMSPFLHSQTFLLHPGVGIYFYSFLDQILPLISSILTVNPSCMALALYVCHFFLLKWDRSWLFNTDLLCDCDCSSSPGSPPCSTHSSHLCFSSYLHHHFCSNLPPTFAYSSRASLLLFRSLSNPLSLCW